MQPWSEDTQQKGDLDGDGQITAADVLIALQIAPVGSPVVLIDVQLSVSES